LQTNSKLTPTTISRLQMLYDYNQPKIFPKFKNKFIAPILSNILQAGIEMVPMLGFYLGPSPTLATSALELHHFPQHQYQPLQPSHLVTTTKTSPCRGMACTHHANPSLWSPQPCTTVSSHLLSLP
jgi:hypothetical protein